MNVGNLTNGVKECLKYLQAYNNPQTQRTALAIALGRAISLEIAMPATAVTDINSYFNDHHNEVINRIIGQINEVYVVDTALVKTVVTSYYRFRYELVYSPALHADMLDRLVALRPEMFPPVINDFITPLTVNKELVHAVTQLLTICQVWAAPVTDTSTANAPLNDINSAASTATI